MKSVNILGVRVDDIDETLFIKKIDQLIQLDKKKFVTTPNPEMLVFANKDNHFKKILNSAKINIPDGAGLKIGARILGVELKNRVTGTDSMFKILQLAEKKDYKVYFLGGISGVAKLAANNIKKVLSNLQIVGAEQGSYDQEDFDKWDNTVIVKHINSVRPDILFIALGHGKQEKWIYEYLKELDTVKLAMGIGGAFDFYAGKVRRAPSYLQNIGLEWLWRLIKEPWRYKRIFIAVIVFPLLCLKAKIKKEKYL